MPEQATTLDREAAFARSSRARLGLFLKEHWQAVLLCTVVFLLYLPVFRRLALQWWTDANYSHGFFIPPFVAFVIWERRRQLRHVPCRPAILGLFVLGASLAVYFTGLLGAELFLARISLVGVVVGLLLYLHGWPMVQALLFPLGAMLLMFPLPALVYNEIVFPLQLLASRVASAGLRDLHIMQVMQQGNVLVLPSTRLEVAEACSGIRSLMSLLTLGLVYGYFAETRAWIRLLICLSIFPIAVFSNAARVMFAAVAAQYWGDSAIEGVPHLISGIVLFVVATLAMVGVHWALKRIAGAEQVDDVDRMDLIHHHIGNPAVNTDHEFSQLPLSRLSTASTLSTPSTSCRVSSSRTAAVIFLLAGAALATHFLHRSESVALRQPLGSIPLQIESWEGRDEPPLEQDVVATAGVDSYLDRLYARDPQTVLSLYVGYYRSQATGDSIHSPKNCLPGNGWLPETSTQVGLQLPNGRTVPVNLYVVHQGSEREVVLYWYQAHGRIIAGEYRAKLYMIADAIRLHRTDGALVRIAMPIVGDPAQTQTAALRFAEQVMPSLQQILPQ